MPNRFAMIVLLGCLAACSASIRAEDQGAMRSPADAWRGYDPQAIPLEVESIKAWGENGCQFEKLRFTAEVASGVKVRVFAIQGSPAAGPPQPGILHIHGGGQTASLDWVRFWAQRGYVAVSFDFCGPWAERTEVTEWGPLKHANMAHANGGYQVDPTARASSWFHWTLASRRALTLLSKHPRVDPERMGIFGISVGGTLCWMVGGSDPRVKTAVPIYGCGYNIDRRKTRWGFPQPSPEMALFQRAMSSEAHAPYISCPVLYLSATNDFHGWMDDSFDTLRAIEGPHWQAFTPRYNHHIAPDLGANLAAWMDYQLRGGPAFPSSPTVELTVAAEGIPTATVKGGTDGMERVDIFYSLGDKPAPNRYWRRANSQRVDASWNGELPVIDTWEPVFAFANAHYASGLCLSTQLAQAVPAQLGKARATIREGDPFESRQAAESWFFATAYTDPVVSKQLMLLYDSQDHAHVVTLNPELFGSSINFNIATHLLGDPQFAGKPGQTLAFDCSGGFGELGMTVTVTEKEWTPLGKSYAAKVSTHELSTDWKTVMLPLSRFQTADAKSAESWRQLDKIQLQGTTTKENPLRVGNLRWIDAAP